MAIAKFFSGGFDALYQALREKKKICGRILNPDLFDGREYTIDQFFSEYAKYFEKPCDFYTDFPSAGPINLRDGMHPRETVISKVPMRRMIFDSPVQTDWEEANVVPFKWFRDPKGRSRTILLFAPGWGRSDQSFEEQWCLRLQSMGVDCGLMTVPFHQARTPSDSFSGEYFISANVFWTISNFRHFAAEIRRLIQYMRDHYEYIGLIGMSSGGFQTSLASNCEEIDFFFPLITGGNLGSITWNGAITQYVRQQLETRGIDETALSKVWSISDEVILGKHCKAHHIKQYISLYDQVVPTRNQYDLWEALGKPEKKELKCAHYSVFFLGNYVLRDIARFINERI